jgi:MFS family permease
VQAFTFFNSVGTALVTNGIFYITASGFGFSRTDNFHLALWIGLTYVVAASATTPALAWVRRRTRLSSRGVLTIVMLLCGCLCLVPLTLQHLPIDEESRPRVQVAGLWFTVLAYNTLTGVLWPVVESYIAGGRRGDDLRKTMGMWNVVWSSAAIPAAIISAPMVEKAPAEVIAMMGGIHLGCLALLRWHTREPVPHLDEHAPHPPVYEPLLVAFRMLMPMAYMVLTTLTPMLAAMFAAQGVAKEWQPIVGLAWVVPRVLSFALFGFWGGWHGTWWAPILGGACIVAGFGIAVTSAVTVGGLGPTAVLGVMVAGLTLFGFGMAAVYTGAIYYAMEVHKSDVDAGGTHETLVGIGYSLGPACGLVATLAVSGRGESNPAESSFGPTLFGMVGLLAVLWTVVVVRKVGRLSKETGKDRQSPV